MRQAVGFPVGGILFYDGIQFNMIGTYAYNRLADILLLFFRQFSGIQRNITSQ